jgi:CRISPR-associated RAMP protein (TIGR02581 family)
MSRSGVVLTASGEPYIPGSSIKGKLRSTAEELAQYLGLKACLLNYSYSEVECCNASDWYKINRERIDQIRREKDAVKKVEAIEKVTCDVCRLFGSPLKAGRLFVSDARCTDWVGILELRNGVAIDRDKQTVAGNLLFDYEVVPPDTEFAFTIEVDDATSSDLALLGAVLLSWEKGFLLGGMAARGVGRVKITSLKAWEANLQDHAQLRDYLLQRKMKEISDWHAYFQEHVDRYLKEVG